MRYETLGFNSVGTRRWLELVVVGFSRETDAATETFLSHFYGRSPPPVPAGAAFISNSAGRFGEVWRTWCEGGEG